MVSRWLNLLLGVALIQGTLTFSLIHEPQDLENEWIEFNQRLDDPNYRLPETTRPIKYDITLTPYFNNVSENITPFSFTGQVDITISTIYSGVNVIVLHCNDLSIDSLSVSYINVNGTTIDITAPNQEFTCDPITSFLRINTNEALDRNQQYIISSTFTGNLQTNMRGFYRSWYRDSSSASSGNIRWMATTQFQPGHARQAFPCYDEPGFKAYFDISISREESFGPTISNMPIANRTVVNGRVLEKFYTTPKTSTYLLAFIVSNYVVVSSNNDTDRPFEIYARDNIGTDGDWSRDVGERLLLAMENYTGISYYNMAPNMDMKQAAIPDFSAGAMENWGLLTYREANILYDPENSNHFNKQRVANIVAHEIAHMWFGNLVTCAWWDNLWLNEGFARYYQYFLTALVEPTLGYETRFIVEQVQVAMVSDSIDSAHPLTNPSVTDPTSVSNHFSTITYARGAAVLKMTRHLLGDDTFEKALRNYLSIRQFDVAEPHHLFDAFDAAAIEDSALTAYNGITIDRYLRTWSEQAGHPLLTVTVNQQTGRMTITQSRFERSIGYSNQPYLYDVPITWTREGAPDFDNLKPTRVMTAQAEIIDRETTGLEWVVFNKQASGFYRVNYDNNNWNLLTRALRTNKNVIHEYNRAQIVDDLFAFARATIMPYSRVFNILSYLQFEDEYAPWIAAITGFNFAIRRLAHDDAQRAELNNLILSLSDAVVDRLGFSEPENEDFMPTLQRMYVMTLLCNVGHEDCIDAARVNFASWKAGGYIPPNMRPWVYCAGLRAGNASDFDYFWNRYLAEDHAAEQVVLITAAGCTSDEASLGRFLEAITTDDNPLNGDVIIRPQDVSTALSSAITSNEANTMRAFRWLQVPANLNRTRDTIGLQSPLNTIISRLLNENQIGEVLTWLDQNRVTLGESLYSVCISAIATARNNIAWYEQRAPEFAAYFETGYVEQELEVVDTGEGGSEETDGEHGSGGEDGGEDGGEHGGEHGGEDGGETDSANIAALSIITLFATLSINFLR